MKVIVDEMPRTPCECKFMKFDDCGIPCCAMDGVSDHCQLVISSQCNKLLGLDGGGTEGKKWGDSMFF